MCDMHATLSSITEVHAEVARSLHDNLAQARYGKRLTCKYSSSTRGSSVCLGEAIHGTGMPDLDPASQRAQAETFGQASLRS